MLQGDPPRTKRWIQAVTYREAIAKRKQLEFDAEIWNSYNKDMLKQLFTSDSTAKSYTALPSLKELRSDWATFASNSCFGSARKVGARDTSQSFQTPSGGFTCKTSREPQSGILRQQVNNPAAGCSPLCFARN
jgi:hypothetical protein